MAKTANDYRNIGAEAFYCNEPRVSGCSWQAKAMQEGYDNAKDKKRERDEALAFAADLENEWHARSLEYVGRKPCSWKMPKDVQKIKDTRNAVESHIDKLRYMATIATPQREYRIKRKIFKLEQKHSSIL